MVQVGDTAPTFELAGTQGTPVALPGLRGRSVVLFFYPAADTPGCTIETKAFRDLYGELKAKGVEVLGISVDDLAAQSSFCSKYGVQFPLLADPTKATAKAYGVLGPRGTARRVTFFIDPAGKIREIVENSKPEPHVAKARELFL
jgi:thioredoxin-dependent peroxiredoxin